MGGCATALFILVVAFPIASLPAVLLIKPLIDLFWFVKIPGPYGMEYNLQSITGLAISFGFGIALLLRRWKPQFAAMNGVVVLYTAITIVGLVRAPEKQQAMQDALRLISPFFLFCAAQYAVDRGINLRSMTFVLAVYSLVPLAMALGQMSGVLVPPEQSVASPETLLRVTGIYHHPLDISWRASVALPFSICLATELARGSPARTAWFWAAVSGILAISSFVRSAIVATGAQVFTILWQGKHRVVAFAAVPLGLAGLLLLPPVRAALNDAIRPVAEGKVYEIGTGRAMLFVAHARAFADATLMEKVLGRGLHSSPSVSRDYSPIPAIASGETETEEGNMGAHNQFLRALTETGLVGLVCTIGIFVGSFMVLRRRSRDPLVGPFAKATLILTTGILIYALVGHPLDFPALSWPFWVCIGLCVDGSNQRGNRIDAGNTGGECE